VLEETGNMWGVRADIRCITTNGFVKNDGRAVMGRGVAKQAADRFSVMYGVDLPAVFGKKLRKHGNHVMVLEDKLITFPVKYNWWERASMPLILASARELVALANENGWRRIVLPRPGCGNGGLDWDDVRPQLAPMLDDRFVIVERAG